MSNLASMFRAVEFIENNLKEEIAVADMADAVSYSLYHFCRMFNQVVHHTPYDYLMRRRLSESARELIKSDKKITEIALDYQFNSPETYSRAFKRLFGTQPYRWKKRKKIDQRRLMPRLTLAHIEHRNKGNYLKPVLEAKEAFYVAGVMTLVGDDQTTISQLWEMFASELQGVKSKVQPERYYGIVCYPKDREQRGFLYLAAVEVKSLNITNPALVVKTIPASQCARFIHKGSDQDLKLTRDYIYQTWLPKSGRRLSYPLEIVDYDNFQTGSQEPEKRIYIFVE
jgi:AraC family transcriptional regulator